MSYFQAILIGLLQGVTELFPISSLGHSVLVPAWLGWDRLVGGQSADESFYLAFLVGLHLATALALLLHYRRDWIDIGRGFVGTVKRRRIETPEERMAWLLIVATIPVGVVGLAFEHSLRVIFAKPFAAAVFLTVNGLILIAGERLRRQSHARTTERAEARAAGTTATVTRQVSIQQLTLRDGVLIGASEILALFAGISRAGVTMVAGLIRGLDHEDAARFSFMLATPVILAAGMYKLHDLLGPNGDGLHGQIIAGSVTAFFAAYAAVRFLERWFTTKTLLPFAIYCLVAGGVSVIRFA